MIKNTIVLLLFFLYGTILFGQDNTENTHQDSNKYPVYRGCDKELNNKDLEECSKRKIMTFIKMSFDIDMASRVMPLNQSTQFLLEFTINKKGKIQNVNA